MSDETETPLEETLPTGESPAEPPAAEAPVDVPAPETPTYATTAPALEMHILGSLLGERWPAELRDRSDSDLRVGLQRLLDKELAEYTILGLRPTAKGRDLLDQWELGLVLLT
ncbi:MAG: hypothetical protein SFY70_06905 [Bacteroidia bacterium]|nr:hypothetical protein [Bacteroidia bacterium]